MRLWRINMMLFTAILVLILVVVAVVLVWRQVTTVAPQDYTPTGLSGTSGAYDAVLAHSR